MTDVTDAAKGYKISAAERERLDALLQAFWERVFAEFGDHANQMLVIVAAHLLAIAEPAEIDSAIGRANDYFACAHDQRGVPLLQLAKIADPLPWKRLRPAAQAERLAWWQPSGELST
jgi:hypothetical protein